MKGIDFHWRTKDQIADWQAIAVIREHKSLPFEALSELIPKGQTETGELFSKKVTLTGLGEHRPPYKYFIVLSS